MLGTEKDGIIVCHLSHLNMAGCHLPFLRK